MRSKTEQKKRTSLMKRLYHEYQALIRPTKKQWLKGTLATFGIAVVGALSISAIDSVFTAFIGLFF